MHQLSLMSSAVAAVPPVTGLHPAARGAVHAALCTPPQPAEGAPAMGATDNLQALLGDRLWRAATLARSHAESIPSGFRALDQELPGGGWPTQCLTELLCPATGIGEIRLVAQALQTLTAAGRQVILLAPPAVPYPAGWAHFGIDPARLLIVKADRPVDRLWAVEQSLRSAAFGALLAWVPEARPEQLRRLQVAASGANGLSFLIRPAAAQHLPSPAPLRLLLEGVEGRTLGVRLVKRRGPVQGAPLRLHLPEVRTFARATPAAVSGSVSGSSHALDRAALPDLAARPHPAPLAG